LASIVGVRDEQRGFVDRGEKHVSQRRSGLFRHDALGDCVVEHGGDRAESILCFTGFLGFRVATDDCGALHDAVVAGGCESVQAPTADGDAITAKVLDSDGYPVEIRQPGTGSVLTR
jgi:hypothetical protein